MPSCRLWQSSVRTPKRRRILCLLTTREPSSPPLVGMGSDRQYMRIGILTYHYVLNYGAILQALGSLKAIRSLGHDPVLVDYLPVWDLRLRRFRLGGSGGLGMGHIVSAAQVQARFSEFSQRHLSLSRPYRIPAEIGEDAGYYHAFVAGSDQVWNCRRFPKGSFDPIYFLGFAENTKAERVSYAACFGRPDQPEEQRPEMSRYLSSFENISVRNGFSQELVKQLTGRDVPIVVDPVFLTDFEEETSPRREKKPYLLIYSVDKACGMKYASTIVKWARKLSLRTIAVTRWSIPGADEHRRAVSPSDWLALFRDAAYVCTDSFHGIAFSMKNRKPFTAFAVHSWRSLRLLDQLMRYGLGNRIITDQSSMPMGGEIDYTAVFRLLNEEVNSSYRYLNSALSDTPRPAYSVAALQVRV